MPEYSKSFKEVGLARETVRGTAVNPATGHYVQFADTEVNIADTKILSSANIGHIAKNKHAKLAKKLATISIGGELDAVMFTSILYATFGTLSTASGTPQANVNTHTFTLSNSNTHPSYTIVATNPAESALQYPLAMLDSLKVNIAEDEFVTFESEWLANVGTTTTVTTSYTADATRFVASDVTVEIDANDTFGSATTLKAKSVSIEIKKNVKQFNGTGSQIATSAINTQFEATVTIEILATDTTYRTLLLSNGYKALRITLTDTEHTIGASSNPKVQFILPTVTLTGRSTSDNETDFSTESLTFELVKGEDADYMSASVVNTQTIGDVKS